MDLKSREFEARLAIQRMLAAGPVCLVSAV